MRHINPFPAFSAEELDDLRKKIVHGILECWTAAEVTDAEHHKKAVLEGAEWTKYPCWLSSVKWEDGKGFKKFKFKGHTLYVHRTSHEVFNGPVQTTQLVDHQCRVRSCCQPLHLEAVTARVNIERGANQNHLLRNGEAPPVKLTATDINSRFFEKGTVEDFINEQTRRAEESRDVKRYHDINVDGPLPKAPPGFFWECNPVDGAFGFHILQPVRETPPMSSIEKLDDVRKIAAQNKVPDTTDFTALEASARSAIEQIEESLRRLDQSANAAVLAFEDWDAGIPVHPTPIELDLRFDTLAAQRAVDRLLSDIHALPDDVRIVLEIEIEVPNGYVPVGSSGERLALFLLRVGDRIRNAWRWLTGRVS